MKKKATERAKERACQLERGASANALRRGRAGCVKRPIWLEPSDKGEV